MGNPSPRLGDGVGRVPASPVPACSLAGPKGRLPRAKQMVMMTCIVYRRRRRRCHRRCRSLLHACYGYVDCLDYKSLEHTGLLYLR